MFLGKQWQMKRSATGGVLEALYLCLPQFALVFLLVIITKICHLQNRLSGHRAFFDSELEVLTLISIIPVKTESLLFNVIYQIGRLK